MTSRVPLRTRLAEAQLALMLLTRLPAGQLSSPASTIPQAAWAFPLAGLAVGALAALILWAALAVLPASIAAGLALAAMMLATGALHEDGLADIADGFGGGRDRARKLEIMRDSRIGSYGTLALIVSVGLRWQLIAALASPAALIAAAVLSRAGLPAVMALVPPARADGMGRLASGPARAVALAAVALGLAAAALLTGPLLALICAAAVAVTLFTLSRIAARQIGGQTGDVLGAMQQISEMAVLIVLVSVARV